MILGGQGGAKNLVGRALRDPWTVLLTSRPGRYRIPEVGKALIELVDHALFERNLDCAISNAVIFRKWAECDLHFQCQAPAVLASVYSVCDMRAEAERQLFEAKKLALKRNCTGCESQYLKREGTFYFYGRKHEDAYQSYSNAFELSFSSGNDIEAAKCLSNRGAVQVIRSEYDKAVEDLERALGLFGSTFSVHVIGTVINLAAAHCLRGRGDLATAQIGQAQDMIKGLPDLERPRLLFRWIRALLLETQNELKLAGEMLERVEARMRSLDMKSEVRVILADRARIARRPDVIRRIARKAHAMEDAPQVLTAIEEVIRSPSIENISNWRDSLNAYVPPLPVA